MSGASKKQRQLKLRCATWDQVELFYDRKVKPDRTLAIKVPFVPKKGEHVSLAMVLPDEMVMAIESEVMALRPAPDGKRAQVKLRVHGLTDEVVGRLRALVADARGTRPISRQATRPPTGSERSDVPEPPPPAPTDAPVDELVEQLPPPRIEDVPTKTRPVFEALEAEVNRLREAAAHDVLGVAWDADVPQIRGAYFSHTKKYHPDVLAKHRCIPVTLLAEQLFIHVNKAYDRMRDAAAEAGKGLVAGPALLPHDGWIAGFEDVEEASELSPSPVRPPPTPQVAPAPPVAVSLSDEAAQPRESDDNDDFEVAPLTEEGLFGDIALDDDAEQAGAQPSAAPQDSQLFASGRVDDNERALVKAMENEARELLQEGAHDQARERLAAALHVDPRNRPLRALYHVANGYCLEAVGKSVDATTQFETALRHDPDCEEARRGLEAKSAKRKGRKSLFGRFFGD